jgi:hypothetical protein
MERKPTNVFSDLKPNWITEYDDVGYDTEFWNIINFFLLHSLCDGQSCKNHTLQEPYLWKKYPWRPDSYLKDKIITAIWGEKERLLYMADNRKTYKSMLEGKNLDKNFYLNTYEQRAGYVKVTKGNGNGNEIMSLLYHIRNGFAHGRYGLVPVSGNDYMIFIEDGEPFSDMFEVTARIALKKSSLVKIRQVILSGPDDAPDYATDIYESIKDGCSTKKKVIAELGISEKIWDKYLNQLKIEEKIKYNKSKRIWEIQ